MEHRPEIRIGEVMLTLDEAEETLRAIRAGRVDAVVVEGSEGEQVYTFRDPGHPYRILVEAMGEGAALTTPDGVICYYNPRFASLVGAHGTELNGRPLAELLLPDARARLEGLFERARTAPLVREEVELLGRHGTVSVQLSASRAQIADVPVLAVVVTDLSEHRRQEELYRAARQEIEARDRVFSVAAHELRGPLGVLELQTDVLGRILRGVAAGQPLPTERALEMVERLHEQGRRLTSLVGKLLDFGTVGAGRLVLSRERMDLAQAAGEVIERVRPLIDQRGSSLAVAAQPVWGTWDRVRVEQVIENLLTNAAKYGQGRPIRLAIGEHGRNARTTVEDEGRGIPSEARERIFRPYERVSASKSVPGLGLGLYITSEIVKAHGGTIRVDATPSGGSRFTVELPLEPD